MRKTDVVEKSGRGVNLGSRFPVEDPVTLRNRVAATVGQEPADDLALGDEEEMEGVEVTVVLEVGHPFGDDDIGGRGVGPQGRIVSP